MGWLLFTIKIYKMKKIVSLLIAFFISAIAMSQSVQTPVNTEKPAPKNLRLLQKADLTITQINIVSATGQNTDWDVRLSVTIKNSGGIITPKFKIRGFAQNAAAAANPWKNFGDIEFPAVGPGQSVTREIRFLDKPWVMHKIPQFNLRLKADGTNLISESNETNNEASPLLISATN
jgi:CARDB